MVKAKSALSLLLFSFLFTIGCNEKAPVAKRVIMLGIDGFSLEGYQKAKTPNIDALFADGVISTETRTVMPSVTMPNWTSHLTGGGPEQHGVFGNDWEKEDHTIAPQEMDEDGYYPSVFKIVKDNVPNIKTAFYFNWKSLIKPFNKKYLDEYRFEEDDRYDQNYQAALDFLVSNQDVPTLIFLYSVHVDHAGHGHEWMSPEFITAIEEIDVKIGEFVNQLKKEGLYEDSNFLLFTDHGGIGKSHGGTSVQEMIVPWMIKGPEINKAVELKSPNSNANTSAVVAKLFGIADTPESWIANVPSGIFSGNE
ncbi:alkaline phosphatase family protein [Cyclobacterium sp. 1_MG-2023]|uniref:alkaline phosphatase family protein n=1 Tax=Cyclobacterium sp. 1_MG-2023 TaxID=3062681 RepID=UPI0026E2E176|nr:alkaline phosphatase family protein [Cyclobacterium sp. 1_MG-2023]MDO6436616.1 alkaline phosphatase family protein [Cyclobacterium sp. 1_MG-2023]